MGLRTRTAQSLLISRISPTFSPLAFLSRDHFVLASSDLHLGLKHNCHLDKVERRVLPHAEMHTLYPYLDRNESKMRRSTGGFPRIRDGFPSGGADYYPTSA